jgi:hypothetical protein
MSEDRNPKGQAGDAASVAAEGYEVGYRKPPFASRFGRDRQPDRSKLRAMPERALNIAALLDRPINVARKGKKTKMHPHEAMMHSLGKRAIKGEIRAIKLFLDECKKAGLLDPPPAEQRRGVFTVPKGVPMEVAARMLKVVGLPPWDQKRYAEVTAEFENDRAHIQQLLKEAKAKSK